MSDHCLCGCNECELDPIWVIIVKREFWGNYGKKCYPYCTYCLMEELMGVHSGGGLTASCIEKIIRYKPKHNILFKNCQYNEDNVFCSEWNEDDPTIEFCRNCQAGKVISNQKTIPKMKEDVVK